MTSHPEPTPYQRHEWNTFMCLLWHSDRIPLPSEPNPYQTQTTRPRSALQLALRDVRSTECMFYEVIQAVCDWLAGGGTKTLVSLKSTPDHDTAVDCESSESRWSNRSTPRNNITISSVALYRKWGRLKLGTVLTFLDKLQAFYSFISLCFCNCEWMHLSASIHSLNGVKCVREGVIICAKTSPEQLHLYTLEGHVSWYNLPLRISCHSICLSLYLSAFQRAKFFFLSARLNVYLSGSLPTYLSLSFNCLARYLFVFMQTPFSTWDTVLPLLWLWELFFGEPEGGVILSWMCNVHCVQPNRAI